MSTKNRTRLTASDRLILAEMRAMDRTVDAADILRTTSISIHTLADSLTRLKQMGLIAQVATGAGPGYELSSAPLNTEVAHD